MALDKYGTGDKLLGATLVFLVTFWLSKPVAVLFAIAATSYVFIRDYQVRQTWSRQGVPGLSSIPLLGTMHHFRNGILECDSASVSRFGKVFGGFFLQYPDLAIADPDLVKQVTVKDFNNFTNRRTFTPEDAEHSEVQMLDQMVTMVSDDHWRLIRSTITPAFTSGKMKQMFPGTVRPVKVLNEVLEEIADKGEEFDVKGVYGAFTMDVITSVAFGTQTNAQRNPNDKLVDEASRVFRTGILSLRFFFLMLFPYISRLLVEHFGIVVIFQRMEYFFGPLLGKLLAERKSAPKKIPDFLQVLLDSTNKNSDSSQTSYDILPGGGGGEFRMDSVVKKRGLTDFEIKSQSLIFLLAGYDTSATTLTFACYALATNPEVQERVIEEVKEAFPGEEAEPDYDTVLHNLPYLEAVIFETLRMYPPAPRFDRLSRTDYDLNGIKLPAGASVSVLAYQIHHDPEIYPEPEVFRPERFLGEERSSRPPHVFLPFGFGPRNCIGMRFALMELKLALAQSLRRFKFAPTETTEVPIPLDSTQLLKPKKTLYLKVVRQ